MRLEIIPVLHIGEIQSGDNIAEIILAALKRDKEGSGAKKSNAAKPSDAAKLEALQLLENDIVMVTQKIVSKAEGRTVKVDTKDPTARLELAKQESVGILRQRDSLIISETNHGFICANAGVDFSNMEDGTAALLPLDPDRSALKILKTLRQKTGKNLAVIITDTFGRPWRKGLTNVAIGSAGIKPILDLKGETDALGNELFATEIAIADELAGASEMVMGKSLGIPVAIIRGCEKSWFGAGNIKKDLLRSAAEDFFR